MRLLENIHSARHLHITRIMKSIALFLAVFVAISHAETPNSAKFAPTIADKTRPPGSAPAGMVWIPGGEFSMGAALNGEGSHEMPMVSDRKSVV